MGTIARIVRLLDERGMSAAELERRSGLATNRVSKWKGGAGVPTTRQLADIARVLGVEVERLLSDAPPPPADPARAYLDALISRYGVDRCVGLILAGTSAAAKPDEPDRGRGSV
jgi:transcriptional regulator with XRE-family HTH domain